LYRPNEKNQVASRKAALEWLDQQQGIVSLGLLLPMEDWVANRADQLEPSNPWRLKLIQDSARGRIDAVVRKAMKSATDGIEWQTAITAWPSIHACGIRGPVPYLKKVVSSDVFDQPGVLGGIIPGAALPIPERNQDAEKEFDAVANHKKVEELLQRAARHPGGYLGLLGIGDFEKTWGRWAGRGQVVCALDSGIDESHLALQRSVRCHALFDHAGNYKEAKYAFDRGCHGTKISSIMAARLIRPSALAYSSVQTLRFGLAPEAQVAAVNVLQGECRREEGTYNQLLSGLDWAVEHMYHPEFGGYEVITLCMEVAAAGFAPAIEVSIDATFEFLSSCGLVPLLPGGNNGSASVTVGTRGTYVGACERDGTPWQGNGRSRLLAPGVDLLCCQPPMPALGMQPLGVHTGSSLATAVVAGAVLLLCERSRRSARDCLHALVQSCNTRGVINLDDAWLSL
jgi:subtilisin family serine protease